MKKKRFGSIICVASVLAALMLLASGTERAWAYFTTNTTALGSHRLALDSEVTTVEEKFTFEDWIKRLTVVNTDASGRPVYVRAIAFSGDPEGLEYPYTEVDPETGATSGADWRLGYTGPDGALPVEDGYCYYGQVQAVQAQGKVRYYGGIILEAGQSAAELLVRIGNVPESPEDARDFNVVVVYETTPVQYDEAGNPYADWSLRLEEIGEGGSR